MALYLSEAEVRALIDMPETLAVVEDAFREHGGGAAPNRPRARIALPAGMLHLMAAAMPALGAAGLKVYTVAQGKARFYVWLYDAASGDLQAIIEADWLGRLRTGAATGVALRHLAPGARSAGLFGAGKQAYTQVLAAYAALDSLQEIEVWARDAGRLEQFCRQAAAAVGRPVRPAASPQALVEAQRVVITCTTATEPVFDGAWLHPGTLVVAAGSNHAYKREVDLTTVVRSRYVLVDALDQARIECGDLLYAADKGAFAWESTLELGRVVAGRVQLPRSDADITLFESQGVALLDVAMAARLAAKARDRGVGRDLHFMT